MDRRTALGALVSVPALAACRPDPPRRDDAKPLVAGGADTVRAVEPLGPPRAGTWKTVDPFLFCVHHVDAYPSGNELMGPAVSLAGRKLGMDFAGKDGFSMYHGQVVPGFPQHPHRGFETVTVTRRGLVDHSDSLGATARYGEGDVQWLTAGRGISHAEMFPLLRRTDPNPAELFQIWLNLPIVDKFAEPHFSMLWSHSVPRHAAIDAAGKTTEVVIVAGSFGPLLPPPPPPKSYASRPGSDVAIWTLKMAPGARFTLPAAAQGTNRRLYFFAGSELRIGGRTIGVRNAIDVHAHLETTIDNGPVESELLMLQGRPIGEPVVQHGPFVMSTRQEIEQAYADYRKTRFGGWPWQSDDPVHAREQGRFAKHADGRVERA